MAAWDGFALAAKMASIATHLEHNLAHSVEQACVILETDAKIHIGTYDNGWPQLAESTQADRVAKGFPANEPLLRTGELRDSIQHNADGEWTGAGKGHCEGYVGSDNPKMRIHELGTDRIPARPMLQAAMVNCEHEIKTLLGVHIQTALEGK